MTKSVKSQGTTFLISGILLLLVATVVMITTLVGLDRADKMASIGGFIAALIPLALSVISLRQSRRARGVEESENQEQRSERQWGRGGDMINIQPGKAVKGDNSTYISIETSGDDPKPLDERHLQEIDRLVRRYTIRHPKRDTGDE